MSKIPDPTIHFHISLSKSLLRICAGICLIYLQFWPAGSLFIVAEILGILEEVF